MQEIIGLFGFLQLIIYFPLIDVKFSPTALLLYNQMTSIVTFDLVPTDDFFPQLFSFPETEPLSESFSDFDFGTFWIMNMGSLFIMIVVTLLQFPLYYFAKCIGCKKVQNYFGESQFWGTPLDVIHGAYVEIVFACLINYLKYTSVGDGGY
jgi:hypothetical protein